MILVFSDTESRWDAIDTYYEGLVVRASHVSGSTVRFRRLETSPEGGDPFWLVQPRWGGTLFNGAKVYGTHYFMAGRPSRLVMLRAPESSGTAHPAWAVIVEDQARILMPAYDPEWEASSL